MNKVEVAKLLAMASTVDQRKTAPENVAGWYEVVGHIGFDDAREAMWEHFRSSTAYLMPAHITAGAFRIKEQRAVTRGDVFCGTHAYYPLPCQRCIEDATEAKDES